MEGSGEHNFSCEHIEGANNKEGVPKTTTHDQKQIHGDGAASSTSRRGQNYRHTHYQTQQLENLFKESPHPDEKQRQAIGRKLNLEANQVKFWFQNRRNQLKGQMDRHENMMLRQENEKFWLESLALKEELKKLVCKTCSGPASLDDEKPQHVDEEHHNLLMENSRLRDKLSRLKSLANQLELVGSSSSSVATDPHVDSAMKNVVSTDLPSMQSDIGGNNIPIEKIKSNGYLELALSAMDELIKLGETNTLLWNQNREGGVETLNFDKYEKAFPPILGTKPPGFVSEASRASAVISMSSSTLVEALLDADRWREMFVGMIGSSTTLDLISGGTGGSKNGALQLMQAEIQVISPSVPARVLKFIRYSQKQAEGVWVVVDLSVDDGMDGVVTRRLPSGCIMHDMSNGYSKVTWIEHTEYDEESIHHQYRGLVSSGLGFGGQKWICALLRHCEYLTAIVSPTANCELTQSTRRCLKGLARRMTSIFCAGVCRTGDQHWDMVTYAQGTPMIMTRRGIQSSGEPLGTILSATISVWMPIKHQLLFELLLTKDLRCVWDVICHEKATENLIHFSMGQDETNPNSITILSTNAWMQQNPIMVLQESASDMTGSLIVYAPVDFKTMSMLMNGSDTSSVALAPSGICIVPGYGESGAPGDEHGSMVTVGFQMLLQDHDVATSYLTTEITDKVNIMVSRMVLGIKEAIVRSGGYTSG